MNERVRFPARPMVGVVGVATDGDTLTNGLAGQHGGNLDNHLHGPGARIFFPVRQPGGMFAVGDMHASMGDGEICFTGVEIAGEVDIRFGAPEGQAGAWPVTELADRWLAARHGRRVRRRAAARLARRPRACSSTSGASRWRTRSSSSRVACDVGWRRRASPARGSRPSHASPSQDRGDPRARSGRSAAAVRLPQHAGVANMARRGTYGIPCPLDVWVRIPPPALGRDTRTPGARRGTPGVRCAVAYGARNGARNAREYRVLRAGRCRSRCRSTTSRTRVAEHVLSRTRPRPNRRSTIRRPPSSPWC